MIERVRDFETRYARVSQADPFDFSARRSHATKQPLDAEKILVRIFFRHRDQKRTITATEIDFDRGIATINGGKIEWLETIRDDELRRACYALGRMGGHVR